MEDTDSVGMALFCTWLQKLGQTWLLFVEDAILRRNLE